MLSSACSRGGEPELLLLRYGISQYPENRISEDGDDRLVPFAWDFYLLRVGRSVILIDTGFSERHLPGYVEVLALTEYMEPVDLLDRAGYTPDDITDIILTHSHFDHAGSLPDFLESDATVHVRREEWTGFQSATRDEPIREAMQRLEEVGKLHLIENDSLLLKIALRGGATIRLEKTGGHTIGSQMVVFTDHSRTWVFSGDECYTVKFCLSETPLPTDVRFSAERNQEALRRMNLLRQDSIGTSFRIFTVHDPDQAEYKVGFYPIN